MSTATELTAGPSSGSRFRATPDASRASADNSGGGRSIGRLLVSALVAALPILVALVLYEAQQFDAAEIPVESHRPRISIPNHDARVLPLVDKLLEGLVPGPEDFVYNPESHALYTGCQDGWIRRVMLDEDGNAAAVEKWAFVGGRPLGVALAPGGRRLYVANAGRGLMAVDDHGSSSPPSVSLLADKADGLRFALPDGVDVAADGTVYFTDASWKHPLEEYVADMLEGRPYGRLLRYDPRSNSTRVLLDGLYFANGVAVEPQGEFVVVCETTIGRCSRYYIAGSKKGQTDVFIGNLPLFPDNIRYDGNGSYWIGFPSVRTWAEEMLFLHPWLRKLAFVASKYFQLGGRSGSGVLEVGLDGNPLSLRSDPKLRSVTGGIHVGNNLYLGSLLENFIGRIQPSTTPVNNE